jgi:DNA-binding response OmpR family regulator
VVGVGSLEVPDIVVADLASLGQLGETLAHPGRGLVIRLSFGATVADVVRVLDSGADACIVDGPIEVLAAHVRSVHRALRWRDDKPS